MEKALIVTGTPGTGKTLVAKRLSKLLGLRSLGVKGLILKNKLYEGYDKKLKTWIIDVDKLNELLIFVIKNARKCVIIDSHLSHFLPKEYVKLCIVTKCDLNILKERLKKRGYNKMKIDENMEAGILNVCYLEALERGHNMVEVDTSIIGNINKQLKKIKIK